MDSDSDALGKTARELVALAWIRGQVWVSAISFWECAMLAERGRVTLPCGAERWRADLIDAGVKEVPLDGRIAVSSAALNWGHRDPADRFIVASAMQLGAMLLTADEKILAWNGEVPRQDARL